MGPSPGTYDRLKQKVKLRMAELLETDAISGTQRASVDQETLRVRLRQLLSQNSGFGMRLEGLNSEEEEQLIEDVASELTGFGLIDALMADPSVSEIMINGPSTVFVEHANGKLERTSFRFTDAQHLRHWIEQVLDRIGHSVNESEPFIDATLPGGSRINVIIPPLALDGPIVTIRKTLRTFNLPELIDLNTLTPLVAEFLKACVQSKVNIVISGGTSTGKTTLVSALSSFVPPTERIITIESNAELQLPGRDHWIRLVARQPNAEGRGEVSIRELVKNALRMRPDRVILGEARGGEALDMIQAMHIGHEGFFTVVHANSPQAALERLEILMLMSGLELPAHACRVQIASAIELIIHLERTIDAGRRIAAISQVLGVSETGFVVEALFQVSQNAVAGSSSLSAGLMATSARPKFSRKFAAAHIDQRDEWYQQPSG